MNMDAGSILVPESDVPSRWISQVQTATVAIIANAKQTAIAWSTIRIMATYACKHTFILWCSKHSIAEWIGCLRLTLLIARRRIRAKYKQPFGAQAEVPLTRQHLNLILTALLLHSQGHNLEVSVLLHGIMSTLRLCTQVRSKACILTFAQTSTRVQRPSHRHIDNRARACADLFTITPSGFLRYFPYLHLAEFLCRSTCVLATIQSRDQKCRCHLSKISPRFRLLRRRTWTNRRVGRVKCHRHEWRVHGRSIV